MHKTGCEEDISGITINPKEDVTDGDDPSTSNYEVSLDIEKSSIAISNIWDSTDKAVKLCLCVMVALISTKTQAVVKKLERNIEVALNFENNFQTVENATFAEISLDSNETEAAVENYIKACTCENMQSFECNTNVLGVNDWLNVCIRSQNSEMEINYLDSLQMTQGENTLNIVSNKRLNDDSISSKTKVTNQNGVHVASVIPASFFSYESSSTATVSGVVFLKLSGSRRRLAIEMDDPSAATSHARALQAASDQESAFSMEVQLEKNELEVADDSNNAIYAVMTGVSGGAAAVVTTATLLMW